MRSATAPGRRTPPTGKNAATLLDVSDNEWRRPSRRLRTARHFEVILVACLALIGFGFVAGLGSTRVALIGGGVVLVAAVVADVLAQRRVGAWGYLEREDDLLIRRGLLVRRLSVVPYGRMQFVDVTAGPVERSLGLATVKLHTAAAATDARIPGLEAEEAARLRDQLATLGEARAAGL
ncbi:MAG: PH domain-containing protein [Actinobacteria bacterium]|nr:PH domain-containing protein [Actinomycetota bacterium]